MEIVSTTYLHLKLLGCIHCDLIIRLMRGFFLLDSDLLPEVRAICNISNHLKAISDLDSFAYWIFK